jgi:hypothetical protein
MRPKRVTALIAKNGDTHFEAVDKEFSKEF